MLSTDPASAAPIPLYVVTPSSMVNFLATCDAATRNWLVATQFKPTPYQHAIIPSADGSIAAAIVCVSKSDDVYALSPLPFALPAGEYALATAVSSTPLDPYSAALSWLLGTYQFVRYKRSSKQSATLVMPPSLDVTRARASYRAIALTRDLVNTPTEDMGPADLADVARDITREFGGVFREIVGDDLLLENFPAIHAVGRASHRPPRLIEITWGDPSHPRVAVIGKGVCFDTGGLNIKGADGMRQMKKDMGGAAHALALAQLVMQAQLPVYLHMLVPAVENAIAGNAYRPGEIVSTRAGLKIEIGNTDAEGRVVLSDAIALAAESKPELLIDFATLTGAARVALGPELPAVFANNQTWFDALWLASITTEDPIWRMPLWQPYHDMIKSQIGDLVNTGGPQAGAVTAALFLERFIPEGQSWIHIDVFSWNLKSRPGRPDGGEAQSLRASFEMLKTRYQN